MGSQRCHPELARCLDGPLDERTSAAGRRRRTRDRDQSPSERHTRAVGAFKPADETAGCVAAAADPRAGLGALPSRRHALHLRARLKAPEAAARPPRRPRGFVPADVTVARTALGRLDGRRGRRPRRRPASTVLALGVVECVACANPGVSPGGSKAVVAADRVRAAVNPRGNGVHAPTHGAELQLGRQDSTARKHAHNAR